MTTRTATAVVVLEAQQVRAQTAISRMAEWCTRVKTWCVTAVCALGAVTTAVAGLARPSGTAAVVLVAVVWAVGVVLVGGFWLLDAYYLCLERHFRPDRARARDLLIRVVAHGAAQVTEAEWRSALTLTAPPRGLRGCWPGIRSAAGSLAVAPFYATLLVLLLVPGTMLILATLAGVS